ncbi:ABC transporter permease [Leptolyngbya sp. 15MV]|nr:ABC transporter permease [Leptolyngbya sp. 15MV]
MMLQQTRAIFVDTYRELNARKLFWVAIGISLLLVVAFAMVGINEKGLTVGWFTVESAFLNTAPVRTQAPMPGAVGPDAALPGGINGAPGVAEPATPLGDFRITPAMFYKFLFAAIAVPFWLTWGAVILALVSTAGMIPEFVSSGSIEAWLSKPISRVRLMLTKYLSALIFVLLQGLVFTGGWFLLIGLRGGSWEPGLFLAIPIVLLVFSSVYCVAALVGFVTRSTIASLIAALVFWLVVFGMHTTESVFHRLKVEHDLRVQRVSATIESLEARKARTLEAAGAQGREVDPAILLSIDSDIARRRDRLAELERNEATPRVGHAITYAVMTVLPKTSEATGLLTRVLMRGDEAERVFDRQGSGPIAQARNTRDAYGVSPREVDRRFNEALRSRTITWIVGTSLAFQAAVVLLLLVLFARKDF